MPDVVRDPSAALALVDRLAATVPEIAIRTQITENGWIPEVVLQDWAARSQALDAAVRFLLDAVDWDEALLWELFELDTSGTAADVISSAWCNAHQAQSDPRSPGQFRDGTTEEESPAEALAYWALSGEPIDARNWRICDRDAALDLLPFVAARMNASPGVYLHTAGDIDDARRVLVMLDPELPDRR